MTLHEDSGEAVNVVVRIYFCWISLTTFAASNLVKSGRACSTSSTACLVAVLWSEPWAQALAKAFRIRLSNLGSMGKQIGLKASIEPLEKDAPARRHWHFGTSYLLHMNNNALPVPRKRHGGLQSPTHPGSTGQMLLQDARGLSPSRRSERLRSPRRRVPRRPGKTALPCPEPRSVPGCQWRRLVSAAL